MLCMGQAFRFLCFFSFFVKTSTAIKVIWWKMLEKFPIVTWTVRHASLHFSKDMRMCHPCYKHINTWMLVLVQMMCFDTWAYHKHNSLDDKALVLKITNPEETMSRILEGLTFAITNTLRPWGGERGQKVAIWRWEHEPLQLQRVVNEYEWRVWEEREHSEILYSWMQHIGFINTISKMAEGQEKYIKTPAIWYQTF